MVDLLLDPLSLYDLSECDDGFSVRIGGLANGVKYCYLYDGWLFAPIDI